MSMSKKIKLLMTEKEITQEQLANGLKISQPALSKKLKKDNWRVDDLQKIAAICGCLYEGNFILTEDKKNLTDFKRKKMTKHD